MSAGSSLRALEQYKTNVQRASSRVATEDSVLSQVGDLLARVKELGIAQGTATANDSTRQVANAEVNQIFQQLISLGNTKFGNEYLFGGEQSTTTPFTATGSGATLAYSTTSPAGSRTVEIGDGQTFQATSDGSEIFIDTGVLDAVRELSLALDPSSPAYGQSGIQSALTKLDSAMNAVQTMVGDVGARANTLDSAQQNLDALKVNITTFKSNLEDVDLEKAMTELTSRQLAYQAALVATSKVNSLNLTDYLR
jgi:flagellar hook-associated protein 3 FlgL